MINAARHMHLLVDKDKDCPLCRGELLGPVLPPRAPFELAGISICGACYQAVWERRRRARAGGMEVSR